MAINWEDELRAFSQVNQAFQARREQDMERARLQIAQNAEERAAALHPYEMASLQSQTAKSNREIAAMRDFNRFQHDLTQGKYRTQAPNGEIVNLADYISQTRTPSGGTLNIPSMGDVMKQRGELTKQGRDIQKTDSDLLNQSIERVRNSQGSAQDFFTIQNAGINISTLVAPQGLTPKQQQEQTAKETESKRDTEQKQVSAMLDRAGKLTGALALVDRQNDLLKTMPTGVGMGGRVKGIQTSLTAGLQINPMAASAQSLLDSQSAALARAFGDAANIAIPERKFAKEFVPQVSDSDDTRATKSLNGLLFLKARFMEDAKIAGATDTPRVMEGAAELDARIDSHLDNLIDVTRRGARISKQQVKDFFGNQYKLLDETQRQRLEKTFDLVAELRLRAKKDPKVKALAKQQGIIL